MRLWDRRSWLQRTADEDELSLVEAAANFVRSGAVLSAHDWTGLCAEGRAALLVAQSYVRVETLDAAGRDIDAAQARAAFDGGRSLARLKSQAAAHGVANAIRQAQAKVSN